MTNNCFLCQKDLRSSNIKCTKCDQLFHIACAKTKLPEEQRNLYICQPCQIKVPIKNKSGIATNNTDKVPTQQADIINPLAAATPANLPEQTTLPEGLPALTAEIKLLRGDMGDLKAHIKYLTEHLTQCYTRLDEYGTRLSTLEKREEDVITLNHTVNTLRQQLNTQAQSALKNDIEISGVTEPTTESPIHIVRVIAQKIGVSIESSDIDYANRAGPKRKSSESTEESMARPLVVRFVSRFKREEFLKAAKVRRTLTTADIEVPGAAKNIYFNERLTKENRLLFRAARISTKEHGYKYCWYKNGTILIRRQEGNPSIQIRNHEDLERILGQCTSAAQPSTAK